MKLKIFIKENWLAVLISLAFVAFLLNEPAETVKAFVTGMQTFASVSAILFSVFVFIGLFNVWVREDQIVKHLGEKAGAKGLFLGAALGTIIHGPLASVFPLMRSLLDKGATLAVVVAVFSAYAIKIPMIPLELKLLGFKFTIIHNLLIFITAPLIGVIMEKLVAPRKDNAARKT